MMRWRLTLERRLTESRLRVLVTPIVSVFAALCVSAVFLIWEGFEPLTVYKDLFDASFTSTTGIADSLTIAIPLTLTGLAAAIVFRMNLFNIGAEGQLYFGAIAASWAGFTLAPDMPGALAVAVVLVAGIGGGALWALPAAVFKVRYGTSEIISTLMLTFVALFLMRYLVFGSKSVWRDPGSPTFPQGKPIDESAELATFGGTRLHWGIFVAIAAVLFIWALVRFTSVGFDMNVVGSSPEAARYAGISSGRVMITALVISGALAGLAGGTEVAGRAHSLDPDGLELNLGFTGIVVAALARYNPFALAVVAVFMGGLRNAGPALQISGDRVPPEVSLMLQGAILLFAIGGEVFTRNRLVFSRRVDDAAAVTR